MQKLTRTVRVAEQISEIELSDGARKALDVFRDELEPRLHPERGDLAHVADWANKLPGQLVRIAAPGSNARNSPHSACARPSGSWAVRRG